MQTNYLTLGLALAFLLVVWYVLYIWGLGTPDIYADLETIRAVVGRNMLLRDDFVLPHYKGTIYLAKPPMVNWLIALSASVVGEVTAFSARLPSALAVLIVAVVLFFWGRRIDGALSGWLAALLWFLMPLTMEKGQSAELELTLAMCVCISAYAFFNSVNTPSRVKSTWLIMLGWAAFALAALTKGPPGMIIIVIVLVAFHGVYGLRRHMLIPHLAGIVVAAAIVGAWLWAVVDRVGFDTLMIRLNPEVIDRLSAPTAINAAPWWFYGPSLFFGALPATLFVWSARSTLSAKALLSLSLAVLLPAIVFSFSAARESRYLLPVYPFIALIGAAGLRALCETKPRWIRAVSDRRPVGIAMVLIGAALLFLIAVGPVIVQHQVWPSGMQAAWAWSVIVLAGFACASLVQQRSKTGAAVLIGLLAIVIGYRGVYLTAVAAERDHRKSPREFAEQLAQRMPADAGVYSYPKLNPGFDFYLRRAVPPLQVPTKLFNFLDNDRVSWLIVDTTRAEPDTLAALSQRERLVKRGEAKIASRQYIAYEVMSL